MSVKRRSERLEIRFICKFWSISFLLDSDTHSKYGSESRRAKSMRLRIHNTVFLLIFFSARESFIPDAATSGWYRYLQKLKPIPEVYGFSRVGLPLPVPTMQKFSDDKIEPCKENFGRQILSSKESLMLTLGCIIPSTDCSMLVSYTCALVSFLSQWAASHIRASGPFFANTKCA